MGQVSTIGLDIAKHVFQAHGADASGHVVFRKKITRAKLIAFMASQPPCLVALEACGGAHYWAREMIRLGHEVKLIAPHYVKPFVKRQKNDAADAEAIVIAAQRPEMRSSSRSLRSNKAGRFYFALENASSTSAPNWSTHSGHASMNTATLSHREFISSNALKKFWLRQAANCQIWCAKSAST